MSSMLIEFAQSQSADEVARQYVVSNRMEIRRRILAMVPFAVAALFLPVWLCVAMAVLDTALEVAGMRLLIHLNPVRQPIRYLATLATFSAGNVVYSTVAALVWQVDDPFAKALAVGAILVNVVHISTARTVHFPLAVTNFIAVATISLIGNAYFWVAAGNGVGLLISTGCVAAAAYFAYITMRVVHEIHAESFRERQAAEAANAAKSRFMAQMSHELRTPLNAILGMGYAELTYATTPEAKERLSTMVQSARSLSVMLDDILDLSAVEAGRLLIRPRVVNLRSEIDLTIALFRQQLADSALTLDLTVAPGLPEFARIDGQRFRQCLSNVLSNALKYTNEGRISIEVTTLAPNLMAMDIADSGPGVPTELRERIFEPFNRGNTAVAGTGLGLSISRTLARRMGGDLTLLPSEGGARFQLTIATPPALPAEMPPPDTQTLVHLAGRRVLVVDDVATNRLVAMTYLRIMGAEPDGVASGAEALQAMAVRQPDLILLDLLMSGMDGMATFRAVRDLGGVAGAIPVIAMTADASDERRRMCLAAGFDGFVSKPISPEMLSTAIQKVIRPLAP